MSRPRPPLQKPRVNSSASIEGWVASVTQTWAKKAALLAVDNLIWLLLGASVLVFSWLSPAFLTPYNAVSILVREAPLGLLVIGQSFTLLTGNFDLSSESTMGFAAMVGALLASPAQAGGIGVVINPFATIMIMVAIGASIGVVNGMFITRLNMNNFIMTLAMMMLLRGATYALSPAGSVGPLPAALAWVGGGVVTQFRAGSGPMVALPVAVLVLVALFAVADVVTRWRPFGRTMYEVGSNRVAAFGAGVNVSLVIVAAYVVSGVTAALAGLVDAGRMSSVTPLTGENLIFPTQAAAVIGGISLFGGRGTLVGAFGGVLLWGVIDSGLQMATVSPFWVDVVRGAVLLLAMAIDAWRVGYLRSVVARRHDEAAAARSDGPTRTPTPVAAP